MFERTRTWKQGVHQSIVVKRRKRKRRKRKDPWRRRLRGAERNGGLCVVGEARCVREERTQQIDGCEI